MQEKYEDCRKNAPKCTLRPHIMQQNGRSVIGENTRRNRTQFGNREENFFQKNALFFQVADSQRVSDF